MKKLVFCGLAVSVLMASAAERGSAVNANWTGAADNYWTNSANWAGGVVPGLCSNQVDGVWEVSGSRLDSAVFDGANFADAATPVTIDLSGLTAVKNVTVQGASTPVVTFGISDAQQLYLTRDTAYDTAGRFSVAAGVVNMPVIEAALGFGGLFEKSQDGSTVENNAAGRLVINKLAPRLAEPGKSGTLRMYFMGSGEIEMAASSSPITGEIRLQNCMAGGRLIFSNDFAVRVTGQTGASGTREYMIAKDTTFTVAAGGNNGVEISYDTLFSGEGILRMQGAAKDYGEGSTISVNAGRVCEIQCPIGTQSNKKADLKFIGGGLSTSKYTLLLRTPDNSCEGDLVAEGYLVLDVDTAERLGNYTRQVELRSGGRLRYSGAGETISKTLVLTNGFSYVEQAGTGPLVLDGEITPMPTAIEFVLVNDTAQEATLVSAVANPAPGSGLKFTKTGTGTWTVMGALSYSGVTQVQKGTLRFAGVAVPPSKVMMSNDTTLEFVGGAGAPASVNLNLELAASVGAKLVVAENCSQTFTVNATHDVGATLAVSAPDGANIVFTGMSETSDATWISWNGDNCCFDENGKLRRGYFAPVDVTIPVRGGVITDGAARVGIVNGGTEGPITLSAQNAAVAALVQKAAEAGTVKLNGGTLTAGALGSDSYAAALTIGETAGDGTFKAANGAFTVNAASANGAVEMKSTADFSAATSITKEGDGMLRLSHAVRGDSPLTINGGAVAMTNLPSFNVLGGGTLVKEGEDTWEPTRSISSFTGGYVISNGVVRPRNGMTVFGQRTNKLVVGDGATLAMNLEAIYNGGSGVSDAASVYFGGRDVHFAGRGVDGRGALQIERSSRNGDMPYLFGNVALDGDTYFNSPEETSQRFSIHMKDSSWATMDMNGHTLVKGGVGKMSVFSVAVTNPGPIVMEATMPTNKSGWCNELLLYYDNDLGDASQSLELQSNAVLTLNFSHTPQRRPITVKGPVTMRVMSGQISNWNNDDNTWLGDVTFDSATPGNHLTVDANNDNPAARIALKGNIAGPGDVSVGPGGGRVDFDGTNTCTGTLAVNGQRGGFLVVSHPEGVPPAERTEINTSRLSGRLSSVADDGLWSWQNILDFANAVPLAEGATMAAFVDAGKTIQVALTDDDITRTEDDFALGKDGPGTLELAGAVEKPIRMTIYDGTLKVTGKVTVTNLTVASDRGASTGRLEVAPNGEIDIAAVTGEIVFAPYGGTLIGKSQSRATIAGKIRQLGADSNGLISGTLKGFTLGGMTRASTNIVEIVDGADIEARMSIAYSTDTSSVDKNTQPVSAVYQTGGKVHNLGHPSDGSNECPYLGGAGAAYYLLSGGEYRSSGYFRLGCYTTFKFNSASLVWEQTGGKLVADSGGKSVGATAVYVGNDNAAFLLYHAGGTACYSNAFTLGMGARANGAMVVTGPDTFCRVLSGKTCNQYENRIALVIRDGAVFEAPSMAMQNGTYVDRRYTVSFDGGTWQSAETKDILRSSTGLIPDLVTVYAGGATFEALASGNTMSVGAPLVAPAGQGIASVALPEKFRKVAAPPAVAIIGESAVAGGAVLRCVYDHALGEVTGIEVVTPGHGYTTAPTVKVRLGADVEQVTPMLGPVAAGGGVTVKGPGTVAFLCTNTYAGVTTVKSGTLKCQCDYAVPSNGAVRVEGGVLDLNGMKAEFSSLELAGGTLSGVSQLTLPATWTIDVAAAHAGSVFTVPAGTAVPAQFALTNYATLPEDVKSFTVLSAPDATVTPTPQYLAEDLPPAWQLYWVGSELKLGVPRGIRIIFR